MFFILVYSTPLHVNFTKDVVTIKARIMTKAWCLPESEPWRYKAQKNVFLDDY